MPFFRNHTKRPHGPHFFGRVKRTSEIQPLPLGHLELYMSTHAHAPGLRERDVDAQAHRGGLTTWRC